MESVEEIQDQESDAEQLDPEADEAVTQIDEQHDQGFGARDMGSRRHDQGPDNHLFDVRKYFLGGRLDMFGIERKPSAFDLIHGFSLQRFMGASIQRVRNREASWPA